MKPRRTRSTDRQRQEWRTRKAAERARERHRNPVTRLKDPQRYYGAWLLDSEARILTDPILDTLTAKHGIDENPLPDREYRKLVEIILADEIQKKIFGK